ncbi:MAG: hypothetical protein HZB53_16850 [Chloroflexi bacterium]|nr:hypothetical protein [Chloroflexota bacterium]
MRQPRWAALVLVILAAAIAPLAGGFAEESLGWRDPATGATHPTPPEISTIHDDMTYVLALAAGFSITDSQTLQLWNQLTDSELLPGAVVSYTNGGGSYPPVVNSGDPGVCTGVLPINRAKTIWPMPERMIVTSSVTSRYNVYTPFFHFPHQNAADLGALHDWAWGITTTLRAYEAYAWGNSSDLTVMSAKCLYTRTSVIATPVTLTAGSLPAFATYLHSLADSYSHKDCIDAMDALGMPWATHSTPPIDASVPACDYHPQTPDADDVHGREFYTYTDALRTDQAIHAVYGELVSRSLQYEGVYAPVSLSAVLSGTQTFSETLYTFVHQWTFDQPANRRAYADALATKIILYQGRQRIWLPAIRR